MFTYQRCTRCVMDNASDPTITFDAEGRCNYCTDVLRRMPTEYFPNEEGKRRLDAMVAEIKETCKNDPYDCIVGVSGASTVLTSYIGGGHKGFVCWRSILMMDWTILSRRKT